MAIASFDDELQRAALEPGLWPDLLQRVSHHAGAFGAILISEAHRIPVPPISPALEPLMGRYYGEGWNRRDIRFKGVDIALRSGSVTDQQIFTDEEMRRAPYYQDLLRPEGCWWFCAVTFGVAGSPWFLTLQRTIGQGAFTPDEVTQLKRLSRPLHTAANLSHALAYAQVSGMVDAFEHLAKPALILDERGLLLRCNPGGQRVLDALADLRHREIMFRDGGNQRNFDSALVQAGVQAQWSGRRRDRTTLVDGTGRVFDVEAMALGDWARYSFTQASFLVFLDEVPAAPGPDASLRSRYGLTPTEIRVATALAEGLSVRAIADRHGVTYETARSQIKSVLSKTGTSRQAELVALVAKLGFISD